MCVCVKYQNSKRFSGVKTSRQIIMNFPMVVQC